MTLKDLASRWETPLGESLDWHLRVALTNFVRGIELGPESIGGYVNRLSAWRDALLAEPDVEVAPDRLYGVLWNVLENKKGDPYFLQTNRLVAAMHEEKAVAFVTDVALQFWLEDYHFVEDPDPNEIFDHIEALNARHYKPDAKIGVPRDAFWLTPLINIAADIVNTARSLSSQPINRRAEAHVVLANRARNLMGLSHQDRGRCLFAVVTQHHIGDQFTTDPSGRPARAIMAPSILEGRCGLKSRFRQWPSKDDVLRYGRTYHLDADERLKQGAEAGAYEAVREPMSLDEVEEFIFLGQITEDFIEPIAIFANEIGATATVEELMVRLHDLTGV